MPKWRLSLNGTLKNIKIIISKVKSKDVINKNRKNKNKSKLKKSYDRFILSLIS